MFFVMIKSCRIPKFLYNPKFNNMIYLRFDRISDFVIITHILKIKAL